MNNKKVILFVFGLSLLPVWMVSDGAGGVEYSQQMEMRIDRLLAEGLSNPKWAENKFAEVELLLEKNKKKLGALTVRFIQVSLLQKRGRVAVGRWQADEKKDAMRVKGQKFLEEAQKGYVAFGKQAEDEVVALEVRLGQAVSSSKRWRQASSYIARTEYALAWTRYYLGVVSDDQELKRSYLDKARKGFGGFTQGGIRHHSIIAECFLGLGMCYFEQERYYAVSEILDMTKPAQVSWPVAPVPPAIFKRITYLRIKALRELPSHLNVTQAAGQYFNILDADKKLDGLELEMLLLWAQSIAVLLEGGEAEVIHRPLRDMLDGVAVRVISHGGGWSGRLVDMLADYKIESAYGLLAQGRKGFANKKYAVAIKSADLGLKLSPVDSIAVELRYLKTAASWNMEDWAVAFEAAWEFLKQHNGDKRADEVCRVGLQAGLKAVKGEGQDGGGEVLSPDAYLKYLDYVGSSMDGHPELKNILWYR
ncbi:MAG: hypothetical protein GY805_31650, partial [Chloroflexi bacterium]|nr:hypothetical protein [Chloroflexota bacterium]